MKYKEAYDKLITAYFRDEIKPYDMDFCFCGTLNDNSGLWYACSYERHRNGGGHHDGIHYNGNELISMELPLLSHLHHSLGTILLRSGHVPGLGFATDHPNYEQELFEAFCKSLEALKQVHISRGELIDEMPEFKKRVLA